MLSFPKATYCILWFLSVSLVRQSAASGPALFLRSSGCPSPPVKANIDLSKILGQWYEISRFPSTWEFGRCIQVLFKQLESGNTMEMLWQQILNNGSVNYAISIASVEEEETPAKLTLNFTKPPNSWPTPYWVLDTDYDNFAVMYSCYPHYHAGLRRTYNTEFTWLMSRTRTMHPLRKHRLKAKLRTYGIYSNMFIDNDHNDCDEHYKRTDILHV